MPLSPYLNALATFSLAFAGTVRIAAGRFFHRRPEPVAVHGDGVLFHLFLTAVRDDGAALLMDLHHELVGFGLRVAEIAAEHVADVAHQIHGIVPNHEVPGDVRGGQDVNGRRGSGLGALPCVWAERNAEGHLSILWGCRAHTGEGPAAKRSETWEAVVGPHRRGPRGEAKRDVGGGGGPTPARAPRRSEAR